MDPYQRFINNHAYGISYIDIPSRTLGIINPHNTKKVDRITWNEFNQYFDYLYDAKA